MANPKTPEEYTHHKIQHQHHGISGAALGIGLILFGLLLKYTNDWPTSLIAIGALCFIGGAARYAMYSK